MRARGANAVESGEQSPPIPCRCPRCYYDLSGPVATWSDRCPTTGVCSECGLAIEWADLLSPPRQRLRWLYEHAGRWWNLRAVWMTTARALLPWLFWRRIELHHQIMPRRLAAWPLVLFASLFCAVAIFLLISGGLVLLMSSPPPANMLTPRVWGTNAALPVSVTMAADYASLTLNQDGTSVTLDAPTEGAPMLHATDLGKIFLVRDYAFEGWRFESIPAITKAEYDETQSRPYNRMLVAPDGVAHMSYIAVNLVKPMPIVAINATELFWRPLKWALTWTGILDVLFAAFGFSFAAMAIVWGCPSEWRRRQVKFPHLLRISVLSFAIVAAFAAASSTVYMVTHGFRSSWLIQTSGVWTGGVTMAYLPP